jgi:GR25 family glycosyltransferase involved in LPS biosynthesis
MNNFPWKETFIVNLDTDTERLENVKKQFDPLGITLRKLSNKREDDWKNAPASDKCRLYCEKSTIGSYYGHYKIWKTMVDENIETALIVEDDIRLDKDFVEKFKKYWEKVPSNWNMVLLGCTTMCKKKQDIYDILYKSVIYQFSKNETVNEYINKIVSFTGLHAYIINLEMAKRLLEASKAIDNIIEIQISLYLNENPDLNVYAFEDYIAIQDLLLYESVNNSGRVPNIINKLADNINILDQNNYKISLAYALNIQIHPYKIFGYTFNILFVILLLTGILLGTFLDIKYALFIAIFFVAVDIFYSSQILKVKINSENYIRLFLNIAVGIFIGFGIRKYRNK